MLPLIALTALSPIFSEISLPNESLDAFALRIAPTAIHETKSRNASTCGAFKRMDNGLYEITVATEGKTRRCTIPNASGSAGTFHTRTSVNGKGFSLSPINTPAYMAINGALYFTSGKGDERSVGTFKSP